jgi:hypothetical protein
VAIGQCLPGEHPTMLPPSGLRPAALGGAVDGKQTGGGGWETERPVEMGGKEYHLAAIFAEYIPQAFL